MREYNFEDMDPDTLSREDIVPYINNAYNYDATRSYTYYNQRLNQLPDETLRSILRSIILANQSRETSHFIKQFMRRSHCPPESVIRFAALTEQEYFRVRDTLKNTYGVTPDSIAAASAIAGVLALEDETGCRFTTDQQHQLTLILTAAGWLGTLDTLKILKGSHGTHTWINEDAFRNYTSGDHDLHKVVAAICSGQQYTRFLEVIESTNDTNSKPLVTGVL